MKRRHAIRPYAWGFTLIELLVVVAIIALLISVLLPAMKGARDQSKQMLCNTNLRTMGQAAYFYAEANKDTVVRGESPEGRIHWSVMLLPGLGYDGSIRDLWRTNSHAGLIDACRKMKIMQCPSFPVAEQALDYICSSFVMPYTQRNINRDGDGGQQGDDYDAGAQTNVDYAEFSRLTAFSKVNPGQFVFLTELHDKIPTNRFNWHDLFLTSQLPFGAYPRIANDRRHPGGVNALFFDGSARTLRHKAMDAGWPNTLGLRLQRFTTVPDGYN